MKSAAVDSTQCKDTVSTDKEDNKVDGNQDARKDGPSIGHNTIIHDGSPFLPCKDLTENQVLKSRHFAITVKFKVRRARKAPGKH